MRNTKDSILLTKMVIAKDGITKINMLPYTLKSDVSDEFWETYLEQISMTLKEFIDCFCEPLDRDGQTLIYRTYNYDAFKLMDGNRNISTTRIKELVDSFVNDGYIEQPLLVNEFLVKLDAQHRISALEQLGLPILFVIRPGFGEQQCAILNDNQISWKAKNFVDLKATLGNESVIALKTMSETFELEIERCDQILNNELRFGGTGLKTKIKRDLVVVTEDQLAEAYKRAAMIRQMAGLSPNQVSKERPVYKGWKDRAFVNACLRLFAAENYDHDRMLHALSNQAWGKLTKISGGLPFKETLSELVFIYNKHLSKSQSRIQVSYKICSSPIVE